MTEHLHMKALRLAEWTTELRNEHLRLSDPDTYLAIMQLKIGGLQESGLFDQLELHDLREQVQGAYAAALEEQFAHDIYCRASDYNVVPGGSSRRCAHITHGHYYEDARRGGFLFDGRVATAGGRVSLRSYSGDSEIGVIEGMTLTTPAGVFRLIETSRSYAAGKLTGVADPDGYRALVDIAQAAFEEREWGRYRVLRDRVRYSPFACCPNCGDRFDRREECSECRGLGFIARDMGDPKCADD